MNTTHRITTRHIRELKGKRKIVALTAYDYSLARLVDQAGVDLILIGDSLGMTMQGEETTVPVTLDNMIYHSRLVSRAVDHALVVADMPFASYTESVEVGYRNAVRLLQEGRVSAVKVEGGVELCPMIEKLVNTGVPVMGHLGLQPQMVLQYGGYLLQARTPEAVEKIIANAKALEQAGCFSLVLEKIPRDVAEMVTNSISIPTIGIASGPLCDGQILVLHDMLGLQPEVKFKFARRYAEVGNTIISAVEQYRDDIKNLNFPTDEESYP